MKRLDFYGNKLLFCRKEEFDNLTVEQMEGVDTAFRLDDSRYQYYTQEGFVLVDVNFLYKNKDLSLASLCINACFSFLKKIYKNDLLDCYVESGIIGDYAFTVGNGIIEIDLVNRRTLHKPKTITTLSQATLYDIGNQHWVCEKGNNHNIPKDKSVNVHEYYDVIVNQNSVECTVDFFERGVGKTQACGSGAFCVGMHLFKIHGKKVVVKTENGDKYFVKDNTISVEI